MEACCTDIWLPYKQLYKIIHRTIHSPEGISTSELEVLLKKHKKDFSSLLNYPLKNDNHRNILLTGSVEDLPISISCHFTTVPKELVSESIIISDMFNLDEFIAIDLLCTAHQQMGRNPGLTRGLIAILLYYDGRKALTNSLRDLFQLTSGISWMTEAPRKVTYLITSFTQSLVDDSNILERILDLLEELDITKETIMLAKYRALGPKKHQNQVLELFKQIRVGLATSIFNWSAQRGLPKVMVSKLIQSLSRCKLDNQSDSLDDVHLTILMSILYSYDTSVLHRVENKNNFIDSLYIIKDTEFISYVYNAFSAENMSGSKNCLVSTAKFGFALSLSSMRQMPQYFPNTLSDIIEQDEQLVEDVLANKTLKFLLCEVLENKMIYKHEFFYRRIHVMLTDFIALMHSKVTELRGRADETARTVTHFVKEGIEPPSNLDHNFENLMLCIGKFYENDRAGLSLCTEFWETMDTSSKATSRSVSLFKFIRLAGELLPTTLFPSYLKMISGLTSCEKSARSAFNLLKQGSGIYGSASLSWEHFFESLTSYYTHLRLQYHPSADSRYKNTLYSRAILPQDIKALHAVLGIIKSVATFDPLARISLCEHPSWAPFSVLLGLLTCSIPIYLKSDILKTLAALGKSKNTGIALLNSLETSQIITVASSSSAVGTCNLETEINQNESRMEFYPITQGILDLIYTLAEVVVLSDLKCDLKKLGFHKYFKFICDQIFLKFYSRNYKDVNEKWIIGKKCLKLFHYLLNNYEVSPQDFNERNEQYMSPGYYLMTQLHTKSNVLYLILLIIEEGRIQLESYSEFLGKKSLEECVLYSLHIMCTALEKQKNFFDSYISANSPILLSGLSKIFLDINPRCGQPDNIWNTTKFVTFVNWLPMHALLAIRILKLVSYYPNSSSQILGAFVRNDYTEMETRQGFVECLESEFSVLHNQEVKNENLYLQIKSEIIHLLQNCLSHPSPNITHFLLGFDVISEMSYIKKQRFYSMESVNNCTVAIVSLLDIHLQIDKSLEEYKPDVEMFIENSYYLLYSLCVNHKTSDTILRFLRSSNDFLARHLNALPFKNFEKSHVLNQTSSLLKCVSIELKISAFNYQISRYQHLFEILVGFLKSNNQKNIVELSHYFSSIPGKAADTNYLKKSPHLLIIKLLDCIVFKQPDFVPPKLEYFDNSLLERIFNDCETSSIQGCRIINIQKVHRILRDELAAVQNSLASGQKAFLLQEVECILTYAISVNEERKSNTATLRFVEAWVEIVEVLFCCMPDFSFYSQRKELLLDVIQNLLDKIVSMCPFFDLYILTSEVIFLLLVCFRSIYAKQASDQITGNTEISISTQVNKEKFPLSKTDFLSLKLILKNILNLIIISGSSSQKLRVNLYGALLNCLRIIEEDEFAEKHKENDGLFQISDIKKPREVMNCASANLVRMVLEVFMSFGDKLIDVICHDCVTGHDICKILALSCIDVVLEIDSMSNYTIFLTDRGYLSNMIESLTKLDKGLCDAVLYSPTNLKSLYVYESQMALFLRIARSSIGAELLVANKLLSILTTMKVFDLYPDLQQENNFDDFVPAADVRFRQILFPALNLCNIIISVLGQQNYSANSKIIYFIFSHYNLFEKILKDGNPFSNVGLLQELTVVTSLLAQIKKNQQFDLYSAEMKSKFCRIDSLMLAVFERFVVLNSISNETDLHHNIFEKLTDSAKSRIKYCLLITSNLCLYCRNFVTNQTNDYKLTYALFSCHLDHNKGITRSSEYQKVSPSINVLIKQLKKANEYVMTQKYISDDISTQKSSAMLDKDLDLHDYNIWPSHLHGQMKDQLFLYSYIVEHCLFLLWIHIDFFLRKTSTSCSSNTITENESFILKGIIVSTISNIKLTVSSINIMNNVIKVYLK